MAAKRRTDDASDTPKKKGFRARPRWQRWLTYLGALTVVGVIAGIGALIAVVEYFGDDVPDISWAERYRPPIVSDVLSGDDQLLGEFYVERRRVVPYDRVPKKLVQAFVAAEDKNYFNHFGIDVVGIARASVQNVMAGRKKSGASTLTQQTAKAILISAWGFERATAKTYHRKICEAILAIRLEQRFTKEEILHLYMNQVYLGHSSYGVQAAAENYFRKNVWDLTLGEMSLLAGLPQAPSKYSPFRHPERARNRRVYVLARMLEEGMISKAEHDEAAAEEVVVFPVEDFFRETAPFVTEHVRRDLVARYSNERLLNDGLKVYATVDLDLEKEAIAASLAGLLDADKRHGYRGPLMTLEPKTDARKGTKAWRQALDKRIAEVRKLQRSKGAAPDSADALAGRNWVGVVLSVTKDEAIVGIGDKVEARLPLDLMRWARTPNTETNWRYTPVIQSIVGVLSEGDLILVREATATEKKATTKKPKKGEPEPLATVVALEQDPELEAALVSMDPKSGYILAMIGGYDFDKSEFNRAFQACRQPGSSFKPIVYSAAIEKLEWTPSTPLIDSPIVFDDVENEKRWKPANFGHDFMGEVPLRYALVNSMNIPAVRTLEAVTPKVAVEWANHLGITSKLNEDLSIALGSSCVTLWDLTHVFAVINQLGKKVKSTFIRRIVDRDGRLLEDHSIYYDPWIALHERLGSGYAKLFETREQLMKPQTAAITSHLLYEAVQYGTGIRAKWMNRYVGGKTGTTNDSFDAWFMGFSADIVTGTWVGYDTYAKPMGKYETGGHTALPIWIDYMSAALKGRPDTPFPIPGGLTWVSINPETGEPATGPGSVRELYEIGKEPKAKESASAVDDAFFRSVDL